MITLKKRYGKWKVIGKKVGIFVMCQCDCKRTKKLVNIYNLHNKQSTRCAKCRAQLPRNLSNHALTNRRRLITKARNAIARCTDKTHTNYHTYGGRGISVYKRWVDDINAFADYLETLDGNDDRTLVLDRIDNQRGYEPDNLRFTSRITSDNNKSTNVILEVNGETNTVAGWARKRKINRMTLKWRLRQGWPVDKAVNEPVK